VNRTCRIAVIVVYALWLMMTVIVRVLTPSAVIPRFVVGFVLIASSVAALICAIMVAESAKTSGYDRRTLFGVIFLVPFAIVCDYFSHL
jgi:hypothetical protein